MNRTVLDRIRKARTTLLLEQPFFGALIFRLKLIVAWNIRTMATDGVSLYYNPKFVETLSGSQLVGTLAHEVMHPALHHHTRRGGRDPRLWNEACDYAINPIIVDAGMMLPEGALLDNCYRGMSAERIYNLRESEQQQQQPHGSQQSGGAAAAGAASGANQSSDPSASSAQDNNPENADGPNPVESEGGIGQVMDAPNPDNPGQPLSGSQQSFEEAQWTAAVREAATVAEGIGKAPVGLDRALKDAGEAQVDWRDRFRKSFAATIPNDYNWMRPNRRFLHAGLYLPGIQREGVGELAVAVDCSGSINERQLGQFASEINRLVEEHRPERLHVLYFDAAVQRVQTFDCGETVEPEPAGGGGTEFAPVVNWLDEQGILPHALIYLTDLWGSFPKEEPPYPVLWVSTSPRVAPFGETIPITAA
jgi:predicted metal-dependent peptidase